METFSEMELSPSKGVLRQAMRFDHERTQSKVNTSLLANVSMMTNGITQH